MTIEILIGDCREVLAGMEPESFHSAVTDPPYHLTSIVKRFGADNAAPAKSNGATGVYARASRGFMGKQWDGGDVAFQPETWAAVWRALKPGGYLLAFGGTRTCHRLACAIEDAGFEIRDTIMWVYGSGFPKSHDTGDAIDHRLLGRWCDEYEFERGPISHSAAFYENFGTALKPACEPIVMARKPLSEKSVAANVLKHGCGALNVDASQIPSGGTHGSAESAGQGSGRATANVNGSAYGMGLGGIVAEPHVAGRWPANLAHDGSPEVLDAFAKSAAPGQSGSVTGNEPSSKTNNVYGQFGGRPATEPRGDTGTAARFFYCAKATADERIGSHPTVKPVALMEWLVRMVTPPGGRVVDPFCGTGSTLVACDRLGFDGIGIDADAQSVADANEKVRRMRARRMIGEVTDRPPVLPGQMEIAL